MSTFQGTATISAMDLRKDTGKILDLADYRNERFLVERAGKAKAVIIPVREYQDYQRVKQESKDAFFKTVDLLQKRLTDKDPKAIEAAVESAIYAVRQENKP